MTTTNYTVDYLRTPLAIREQCGYIFSLSLQDKLKHFTYQPQKLVVATDYVTDEIIKNYPTLAIPYHSRWRHFDLAGVNRIEKLNHAISHLPENEKIKCLFDLVILSVLLDAGAGDKWSYQDPLSDKTFSRSEGLAIASFNLFCAGAFSADPQQPLRADLSKIADFSEKELAAGFQVTPANPLNGLSGRVQLLNQLGTVFATHPHFTHKPQRVGDIYDLLIAKTSGNTLSATDILSTVLQIFSPIWPGRIMLDNHNLGDAWYYNDRIIPFHKLSQWLTYSLLEPLQQQGIKISDLNQLTGLAEYRNGGLFIDLEVITPKQPDITRLPQSADSSVVIEWRALTICLLDKLAILIQDKLNKTAADLPLASILQGGTWSAGRRIAKEKRPRGEPPIQIISDGTVF